MVLDHGGASRSPICHDPLIGNGMYGSNGETKGERRHSAPGEGKNAEKMRTWYRGERYYIGGHEG